MSRDRQALLALTRFEIRRGMGRQGAWMGALIFVVLLAIGMYDYRVRNGQAGVLFAEGSVVWLMGLVGFGLAIDRRRAFDEYLIRNHLSVGSYVAAKVIAMVALVIIAAAVGFVLRVVATSDVSGSLWAAACMMLVGLMIAPLAMMVESQADTSMPAAIVVLGYIVLGVLLLATRHSWFIFDLAGIRQLAFGSWASVGPLAIRTAIVVVVGFAVAGALVRLSLRRY